MQTIDQTEARHLLREVPYAEWLQIGRMMIPKGIHQARISSLSELEWTIRPTAKTLVLMRFDNLEQWLREAVGDHTLAETVLAIRSRDIPYVEQSQAVYDAVAERVAALKEAAGEEEVRHA
jgi:hypothetical protein